MSEHIHDENCSCCEDHEEIITLFDEEGNETDFVIVDGVEYNEKMYIAVVEAEHADDPECEFVILRGDELDGEDLLSTIDDEEEFNEVMKLLEEKLMDTYDIDGVIEDEDFDDNYDEEYDDQDEDEE